MKKVLIPTKLDHVTSDLLAEHGGYSVVQDDTKPIEDLADAHPDTHALIVRSEKVSAAIIAALPQLKVVIRAGAGYNTIDTKAARARGVDVMNTPGANSNAVAEEVVAMMLADARHIVAADPSTRAGEWEKQKFMGSEITGKTVGIVGLGYIGQLVARRLSGFECNLLGYDPVVTAERAEHFHVSTTSLEELFAKSDYITLHMPENNETRGCINAALLGLMKPGATLINCARAGILDEAALREIKHQKKLRFLNDVYPKDEPGPKSVADIADLMLPHLGASTREANRNAAIRAAEQLIDFDDKGIMSYVVNRDIPIGLDEHFCDLAYTVAKLCRCIATPQAKPSHIESSIYGSLAPYADWLRTSIVAGICEDFDRTSSPQQTNNYLEERDLAFTNRPVDENKKFENSITVDLSAELDDEHTRHVSVRGTVEEGVLLISRINEFDKLYFEPVGPVVLFLYKDRPGVIGTIGRRLAEEGINIEDMRNPHDTKTDRSLAILKINQRASEKIMQAIKTEIEAMAAFSIKF
ncbi:MAG: NAD(P)-dependent oxidoreductase [Kiritimatiellia bacterium]